MKAIRKLIGRIPFVKPLYHRIYDFFVIKNPLTYEHRFDGLATRANLSFMKDPSFKRYYQNSVRVSGQDYRFYLRVHQALWCASYASKYEGDFVELGTGKGFTFAAISEYLADKKSSKSVFLYDTFLPFKTDPGTGIQSKTQVKSNFYAEGIESIRAKFDQYKFVHLVQGKCPETLKTQFENKQNKISFLHVDLNYFKAEIDSLNFLWDNLTKGAVILLDDYANPGREIQNAEFEKFFSSKGLMILTLASGQGLVIRT